MAGHALTSQARSPISSVDYGEVPSPALNEAPPNEKLTSILTFCQMLVNGASWISGTHVCCRRRPVILLCQKAVDEKSFAEFIKLVYDVSTILLVAKQRGRRLRAMAIVLPLWGLCLIQIELSEDGDSPAVAADL